MSSFNLKQEAEVFGLFYSLCFFFDETVCVYSILNMSIYAMQSPIWVHSFNEHMAWAPIDTKKVCIAIKHGI